MKQRPLFRIAEAVRLPNRLLGLHFFGPVRVQKDIPCFVMNRIFCAAFREALRLVASGVATVEDVDVGMRLGYGWRAGPFEIADNAGLDTYLLIGRSMKALGEESLAPSGELIFYTGIDRITVKFDMHDETSRLLWRCADTSCFDCGISEHGSIQVQAERSREGLVPPFSGFSVP